jgi:NAD(P)H-binding
MSKYVLLGSTNETALHFIRQGSIANLKVLCLYSYLSHKFNIDRQAPLISSLGGFPVRYNFRSAINPAVHGFHGPATLKTILAEADGVIWADQPTFKDQSWKETGEAAAKQIFEQYLAALKTTFKVMRAAKLNRFLYLGHNTIRFPYVDGRLWTPEHAFDDGSRLWDACVLESLSLTMKQDIDWTIIRTGRYVDYSPRTEEKGGIEFGAMSMDGVRREDVARTMVEVLKGGGLSRVVLDVKSVPPSEGNSIAEVVSRAKGNKIASLGNDPSRDAGIHSFNLTNSEPPEVDANSPSPSLSQLNSLFSAADPILSTLNRKNFPTQFAQTVQQDANNALTKLLQELCTSRTHNEAAFDRELERGKELRRARETARLEAQKKGLPPPGADTIMHTKSAPRQVRRPAIGMARAAINVYGAPKMGSRRLRPRRPMQQGEPATMSAVTVKSEESRKRSEGGVVGAMADLFDRSADFLSPQLEMLPSEGGYLIGEDFSRSQYALWRSQPTTG